MDYKKVPENQYVELFLSAEIVNKNLISKPSPYVSLKYTLQGQDEVVLGKTEVSKTTLQPIWETSFKIDY
jgi:C2 domain